MSKYYKKVIILITLFLLQQNIYAQACFPDKIVTAAYATGGESVNKEKVIWLTWGSTNQANEPYGSHNKPLNVGSKSYASISLGGTKYLCIEATITNISGSGGVNSYRPGNYTGDSFDNMYNIGGIGNNNQLIAGIRNSQNGQEISLEISCKATINGQPIRITGMVLADAESLASSEYIHATADGSWNVVEVRKNPGQGEYNIRKENIRNDTRKTIKFLKGNDNNTAAIAFLTFNESAYNKDVQNPDLSVNFSATLKGGGLTAIAIGLLTPSIDLGDAPESYGSPLHILQNVTISDDKINYYQNFLNTNETNVNNNNYKPGVLIPTVGSYLGSMPPDSDVGSMFSSDALGDDKSPIGNPIINEEDAWPTNLKRFSYKAGYVPGNIIKASIIYKGAKKNSKISGWIDFNLNGVFEESERVTETVKQDGDGSVSLQWIVPATRIVYNTYVRLRYFDVSEPDATSPLRSVNFGEVEDHKIFILGPSRTNPNIPAKSKR